MVICPLSDTAYFWQMCGGKVRPEYDAQQPVLRCEKCGATWNAETKNLISTGTDDDYEFRALP